VNGNLNLSRAIGDLKYKGNQQLPPADQIITAQPDIVKVPPLGLPLRRHCPRSASPGRRRWSCAGHAPLQSPPEPSWRASRQASAGRARGACGHLGGALRGAAPTARTAARLRLPTAAPRRRPADSAL
jgi:hypothetical protein